MLAGVCLLHIACPVFMIGCLAGVDVAADDLEVFGVEASNHEGWVAESQDESQ